MKKCTCIVVVCMSVFLCVSVVFSSDDIVTGSVIPINTPDGIVFQVWYDESLESCSPSDVNISIKKAVLKGKSVMASFFKDSVKSSESITQVEKIIKTSSQSSSGHAREMAETFVTQIVNSSEHVLRGVLVEEQKIDCSNKTVKIKLVTSPKTRSSAASLSKEMNSGDGTMKNSASESPSSVQRKNPGDIY